LCPLRACTLQTRRVKKRSGKRRRKSMNCGKLIINKDRRGEKGNMRDKMCTKELCIRQRQPSAGIVNGWRIK
jgi:hypothetical protein